MFCRLNKNKIYSAYFLKLNSNRKKQVILLMIPNGEGRHYLAVKKLSALLRRITSKHQDNFYCLNCFYSFRAEYTLKSHNMKIRIFVTL